MINKTVYKIDVVYKTYKTKVRLSSLVNPNYDSDAKNI